MRQMRPINSLSHPPRAGEVVGAAAAAVDGKRRGDALRYRRRQWPPGAPREAAWSQTVAEGLTVEQMAERFGMSCETMARIHKAFTAVAERRLRRLAP